MPASTTMDSFKRSASVDTLSEYVAQMQATTSAVPNDSSADLEPPKTVEHILLSCTLNAIHSPVVFKAEQVPLETPAHVHTAPSACSEEDLYFLRWVFEGCFEHLTSVVQTQYPGFKILRAEAEPGISWADFREGRRGFCVWLVRIKARDDPLSALRDLLSSATTTGESSKTVQSREAILASLVGKQVGVLRRQMRQFYKEIEETEQQLTQIWSVVADLSTSATTAATAANAGNGYESSGIEASMSSSTKKSGTKKGGAPLTEYHGGGAGEGGASEWSVVDEDEDRDLTSLSGYDSASDGDD